MGKKRSEINRMEEREKKKEQNDNDIIRKKVCANRC